MAAQISEKSNLALQAQKASNVHVEDIQSSELLNAKGGDYSGATAKTDEVEIRLVRKLDLRIMPILWMMYFLNYLDRNAIANARLNNLEEDLHLVGTQYNTCISILFIGYLLMQIPSNMFMSSPKIRPSLFMSVCMASWAIVSALTALTKNYVSLVLVRFFLGVTEAPFYPGALFLLSLFYTRKEIALRISILYTGNIVATAVAGLIAAATFATLDQKHNLKGWQWLFIIEGVVTFFIAALGLLMLPDHPLTTRWLTPAERQLAHDRITRDTVAHAAPGPETSRTWTALRDALRDPRLYLLAFMQNMHLSACSFNNFFPTVVGSLGFDRTMTLVLTCPPYLVSGVCSVIIGMTSGRYNERTWHITGSMGLAVIGFVIACLTLNTAARYLACFLFASGAYAVNSVILGWVSATLGQTPQKKAASLSVVNVVANASYVYTAYLYPKSDGPRYLVAMSANAAFGVLTIASAWGLRGWLRRTNRAIREGRVPGGDERVLYAY